MHATGILITETMEECKSSLTVFAAGYFCKF